MNPILAFVLSWVAIIVIYMLFTEWRYNRWKRKFDASKRLYTRDLNTGDYVCSYTGGVIVADSPEMYTEVGRGNLIYMPDELLGYCRNLKSESEVN